MKIIFYLVLFVLAIIIGLVLTTHSGYVLVAYQHWTVEMPLWFAVVALIIIFMVLYYGFRFLSSVEATGGRLRDWYQHRAHERSNKFFSRGLLDLVAGEWEDAEKSLLKAVDNSPVPVILYLAAANAAQEQNASDRRDRYIYKAYECAPDETLAIGITQAQLQVKAQQFESALATLQHLHQTSPNQTLVLQFLCELYKQLNDWSSLQELLPTLRKHKILKSEESEALEKDIYTHLFKKSADDAAAMNVLWIEMPKWLRYDASLCCLYCSIQIQNEQHDEVFRRLSDFLKKEWNDDLIDLLGLTIIPDVDKQLHFAEGFLKDQDRNTHLLVALARIAISGQYWNKAKEYLLNAQSIEPKPEIFAFLGYVYENTGDVAKALETYKQGYGLIATNL